ncbi:non-specific serine,threonine protein kinase [Sarracenia purpurea var. burkii]
MSRQPPASSHTNVDDGLKESIETSQEGNCSNGKCSFSLTTKNKRIRAPFKHTTNQKNKLIRKSDESTGQITSQEDELKIYDVDGALEIDINQVLQSSSPVPPPFFDTKSRDDNSSDPGSSNRSSEKYPAKRLLEKNISRAGGEIGDRNYSKIPKKVNCGFATSKWGTKFGELSGAKEPIIPDLCHASESICAFCQSSILSDRTGPMLHYANGKAVGRDAEKNVNVIHVHEICLEWAPQAYFLDEKVKNLKAEVARAAKLKCSGCGLKGAALGCLVKSCRKSYHVPCAIEILGCRWDFEDFLMLCPNHSSVKFPREKKFGKNASEKQHFVPTEM